MLQNAHWICDPLGERDICPVFCCDFTTDKAVVKATLYASSRGVYEAFIDDTRLGEQVMTPGWTVYETRTQYQEYDVTALIGKQNSLKLRMASGWYKGLEGKWTEPPPSAANRKFAVIAALYLEFQDGTTRTVVTDESWQVADNELRFCMVYHGCVYDATVNPLYDRYAVIAENDDRSMLIPQEGEPILLHEELKPIAVIHTPKGETVLDFGQNITGSVALSLTASAGDKVAISFGEILDGDGNFYNANYRRAKCLYEYTCRDGYQEFMPTLTFYGFRYVRVDAYPGKVDPDAFRAVVIHSRLRRTGYIETSNPLLNQLFQNVIWGQRGNYLDIPTDCPQRDERLGWTGDAQVFIGAACYNFDVRKFFYKWLRDMAAAQRDHGGIPVVVPDMVGNGEFFAAAWSDAVTIIPWHLYQFYGDTTFMKMMFPTMCRWVDYVTNVTPSFPLWTDHFQYGDWLGLDAPYGEYKGSSREDFLATAFYAHSTELVCRIGHLLGEDVSRYDQLYQEIVSGFKAAFDGDFRTQTEHVVALRFGLTDNPVSTAASLAAMIERDGVQLKTGFMGTPYLLHVLSDYGYADLAYQLLLRTEFPSWLYPVTQGATTIWEHWDNIRPDGTLWDTEMNSFNHYAYGSVADWMYGVCAGIKAETPGFETVRFCPTPTDRLEHFSASLDTDYGTISSRWWHEDGVIKYELTTPRPAVAIIEGKTYHLEAGSYQF